MMATNNDSSRSLTKILVPPEEVKYMVKLDKNAFAKRFQLPAINLDPTSSILDVLEILKVYRLKLMNFKPVIEIEPQDKQNVVDKTVVLSPDLIQSFDSFNEYAKVKLKEQNITENNFHFLERTITFDNWSTEDLIRAILPDNLNFSGYSIIGHIAHFNLNESMLDYKYVLGEIILNKVKNVRTVVNKIHVIENTYRNFQMELICGDNDLLTKVKENNCTFEMDFEKVYWNPRLGTEHSRIVRLLDKNDILFDVFAGIGPFVIPAAKKGCHVIANDLNPEAYKWLNHNIKLNKVVKNVTCFNLDAKCFIESHLKNELLDIKSNDRVKVHITMNLPACAVEFLNSFCGLVTEEEYVSVPKDIICHLYCFISEANLEKLDEKYLANRAKELVETHLQREVEDCNVVEIIKIRKVAPNKAMFRVSFLFEPDFLIRKSLKRSNEDDGDSTIKK